jgi:hypothetical protein
LLCVTAKPGGRRPLWVKTYRISRAALLAMIEATVEGDKMDVGANCTPEGVRFAFHSVVLSAVKPG